jgi:hypothetical protein
VLPRAADAGAADYTRREAIAQDAASVFLRGQATTPAASGPPLLAGTSPRA